jgi:hypothetical protein
MTTGCGTSSTGRIGSRAGSKHSRALTWINTGSRALPVCSNGYSSCNRALDHLRRLMPPMPLAVQNQRLLFYFWPRHQFSPCSKDIAGCLKRKSGLRK